MVAPGCGWGFAGMPCSISLEKFYLKKVEKETLENMKKQQ